MCGGTRRIASRAAAGVSPVRTIVRIGTDGSPLSLRQSPMPISGRSRLRWMSLDSAFIGDT